MKEEEKHAVVEYVRWLAMRGEMEKRLGDELSDYNRPSLEAAAKEARENYDAAVKAGQKPEKPLTVREMLASAQTSFAAYEKEEFPGIVDETADFVADVWTRADDEASVIVPKVPRVPDTPESRQRGRILYMSNRTKCYTCHGPLGRGDGGATEDFWKDPTTNQTYAQRGLHDLWGNKLPPRDLTKGQYRGGRRPIDLYRRMFAGIKGTPMPAFGGTVLKDEEIWDLVNYVMSLPFESQTPSPAKPAAMASVRVEGEN
jgi:mono/diheme cytochrome c family protein